MVLRENDMWWKILLYRLAPSNCHNVRYLLGPNIGYAYYDWHVRTAKEIAQWHLNQARALNRDFDRELSELRRERREHRERQRKVSLQRAFRVEGTEG